MRQIRKRLPETDAEYFLSFVEPVTESGCWIWMGPTNHIDNGPGTLRGRIMIRNRRSLAHRLSYELFVGDIPNDLQVNHKCDVSICVNPDHLYAGTPGDNAIDRDLRNRRFVKLTVEEAKSIRSEMGRGVDVAKKYNVSPGLVSMIRSGKCWKSERFEALGE